MSGTALEKLFFTIALVDKVTKPAYAAKTSIVKMQETAHDGFMRVGKGALAMGGAFKWLSAFTGPARDFSKAVGEVASLGVAQSELDKLGEKGKEFAMNFGGSAADIVRSGYDIQSAIPGLAKGALAEFTYQGAVLAKAGKSSAATITSYMGTMYNIFKADAEKIGQAEWVGQLSGKTAHAIKVFKTTGDNMSAAFTNLGSNAKLAGVSMDEQIAIIGQLQGTMGGANAGTAYAGFLNKTADAAKALGMKFTDAQGKLLPMPDILDKISKGAKYANGDLTDASKSGIMKAFGETGGKAVLNLLKDTKALRDNMKDLSGITNADPAVAMARKMTDAADVFNSTLEVVRMTLGASLLPVVNSVFSAMSGGLKVFVWFLDRVPPLRWAIAGVILAVSALTAALGAMWVVLGFQKIITAAMMKYKILRICILHNTRAVNAGTLSHKLAEAAMWSYNTAAGKSALGIKLYTGASLLWQAVTQKGVFWSKLGAMWKGAHNLLTLKGTLTLWGHIGATQTLTAAQMRAAAAEKLIVGIKWLFNAALIVGKIILMAGMIPAMIIWISVLGIAKAALLLANGAMWLLNTAFYASPLGWVALAIMAIIAAVVAVIYWWDEWTGALMTFGKWCWDGVISAFQTLCGWFDSAKSSLGAFGGILYALPIIGQIMQIRDLCGWISELWNESESFTDFLKNVFFGTVEAIWSPFREFFGWLSKAFDAVPEMFSKLSFLWDWIPGLNAAGDVNITEKTKPESLTVQEGKRLTVTGDSISNRTNATYINVGSVNARNGISPAQLQEYAVLQ